MSTKRRTPVKPAKPAPAQQPAKSPTKPATNQRRRSTSATPRLLALLRGINVGGNKRVPMDELREVAASCGWRDVTTYIQSGNLVGACKEPPAEAAQNLAAAIEARFGFVVPVVVCTRDEWHAMLAGNPFSSAARERPNLLHLAVAQVPLGAEHAAALTARAGANEQVAAAAGGLWLDYGDGVARSKLTPAVLDKAAGAPMTARNFRTVQALAALLRGEAIAAD